MTWYHLQAYCKEEKITLLDPWCAKVHKVARSLRDRFLQSSCLFLWASSGWQEAELNVMQHWYENTTQHGEVRINKLSLRLLWWIMGLLCYFSWWTRLNGNKLLLLRENKLIHPTMLTCLQKVFMNNIRIMNAFIIPLVQKAARVRSQTQGNMSVLGCVFPSIFMVSIVVCLAELPRFSIHACHGLERARPWATGLDRSNNYTNIHKCAHNSHTDNTQAEVTQVRWEVKKSIPVKGLNLLTGKTNFR